MLRCVISSTNWSSRTRSGVTGSGSRLNVTIFKLSHCQTALLGNLAGGSGGGCRLLPSLPPWNERSESARIWTAMQWQWNISFQKIIQCNIWVGLMFFLTKTYKNLCLVVFFDILYYMWKITLSICRLSTHHINLKIFKDHIIA